MKPTRVKHHFVYVSQRRAGSTGWVHELHLRDVSTASKVLNANNGEQRFRPYLLLCWRRCGYRVRCDGTFRSDPSVHCGWYSLVWWLGVSSLLFEIDAPGAKVQMCRSRGNERKALPFMCARVLQGLIF